MTKISLVYVHSFPKILDKEILYVSKEFEIATHLCPCGCKNKIITPLNPAKWSFTDHKGKPTLFPSIGNWQLPCRSHYWIRKGVIEWSNQWTEKEIQQGRKMEEIKREKYFNSRKKSRGSFWKKVKNWFKK